MHESLRKKLDARSRWQLEQGAVNGPVEVLLRLEAEPTPAQRTELHAIGCQLRATAGSVLSAQLEAAQLTQLAQLPFVESVQLARALFNEGT